MINGLWSELDSRPVGLEVDSNHQAWCILQHADSPAQTSAMMTQSQIPNQCANALPLQWNLTNLIDYKKKKNVIKDHIYVAFRPQLIYSVIEICWWGGKNSKLFSREISSDRLVEDGMFYRTGHLVQNRLRYDTMIIRSSWLVGCCWIQDLGSIDRYVNERECKTDIEL